MEIVWQNPGLVVARVGAKTLRVGGEALIEGDTHFVIYSRYITSWTDGSAISPDERDSILRDVVEEARKRGWNFVVQ
jgi:Immunity protein 74